MNSANEHVMGVMTSASTKRLPCFLCAKDMAILLRRKGGRLSAFPNVGVMVRCLENIHNTRQTPSAYSRASLIGRSSHNPTPTRHQVLLRYASNHLGERHGAP